MQRRDRTVSPEEIPRTLQVFIQVFVWTLAAVLLACTLLFCFRSLHWPLVGDAALIRYGNFLMGRGIAPYRDIIDPNMPGAYLADSFVVQTLGPGALAWRCFDFGLIAAAFVAMLWIARRRDWFAACFAGALLLLIHGRDGIDQTGQRDLLVAVALLLACAALFGALRQSQPALAAFFSFFAGAATTIKPPAVLLGLALLLLAIIALHRRHRPVVAVIGYTAAGLLPCAAAGLFLLRYHAVPAFLEILRSLVPLHASIGRLPFGTLLAHSIPSYLLPVIVLWLLTLPFAGGTGQLSRWERLALLTGIGFGLFSFLIQGKGFPYHRYPLLVFLLLLVALDLSEALRRRGFPRIIAGAALAYGALVLAPVCMAKSSRYDWRNQEFTAALERDLAREGGSALSGHVQCMDTTAGCITALLHMGVAQSTGFLYDCYLFQPQPSPYARGLQMRLRDGLKRTPPALIVVTDQFCFESAPGYGKLHNWPAFGALLNANYALVTEHGGPPEQRPLLHWWSQPRVPFGYRLYRLATPAPNARVNR